MNRTTRAALGALAGATLLGCAVGGSMPAPEVLVRAPNAPERKILERGRALVVTSCAECHRQHWPHEYSPREWRSVMGTMGSRASLSAADRAAVLTYLQAAARHQRAARARGQEALGPPR